MSEEECRILITVTVYDSTADKVIRSLRNNTFELRDGGEFEITDATLAPEPGVQ